MNALLQQIEDRQLRRFEEDLAARLEVLFRRCPDLCGFTVQEDVVAPGYLTCHPAQDQEGAEALLAEVTQMLSELAEECPEGAELLHGRTFARAVH
jgi:hypothetical protein